MKRKNDRTGNDFIPSPFQPSLRYLTQRYFDKDTMVRPRGCFICGQLGHLAEKCEFTERRCFNCLEPGHESSACEAPRTMDTKQCYGCGGKGHIRADCPTPLPKGEGQRAAQACYTCGEVGHISKACPTTVTAANGREVSAAAAAATKVKCENCKRTNHVTEDCRAPAGSTVAARKRKPRVKKCHSCAQPGHIAKDCPTSQPAMAEAPGSNADAALTA